MIKQATVLYASFANHTQSICEWIPAQLPLPTTLINLTPYDQHCTTHFSKEDLVIFAVPSFGGRVPAITLQKFQECKGTQTPCILLVTYGNRDYDDTLLELQETLETQGFFTIGAITAICEHSIMKSFASHRPDPSDFIKLASFFDQLMQKLNSNQLTPISVKGTHPYKEYHGIPLKPKVTNACTSCGLCVRECPVGAITLQDTNKDRCISCMRCITLCPQHAREVNSIMVKASTLKMKKECSKRKEYELFL